MHFYAPRQRMARLVHGTDAQKGGSHGRDSEKELVCAVKEGGHGVGGECPRRLQGTRPEAGLIELGKDQLLPEKDQDGWQAI